MKTKTIAVVGLGYVGLPLALIADEKGYDVIGIDTNTEKINLLLEHKNPFTDRHVSQLLPGSKATFSADCSLVEQAETIIVCVPTPIDHKQMPNLKPLTDACKCIAPYLKPGHLVVIESTINPGVCEEIVVPTLEENTNLKVGTDLYLAHCPERINPGDPKWHVGNIPRVVGASDPIALEKAFEFYTAIVEAPIKKMGSIKEAEAVKVVENSFRDINIAFANELAMSFSKLGIDVKNVIDGAATKPFAFMAHYPSRGVGGHCIPVDPYYLIEYAKKNGFHHDFLSRARRINSQMPEFTIQQLVKALNGRKIAMNGTNIAVLGISYKPDIDDYRESPSFHLINHLKELGANVSTYDPYVPKHSTASSFEDAVKNAKAVVVATPHKEFKDLCAQRLADASVEIVVDGMNALNKESFTSRGLDYVGVGR